RRARLGHRLFRRRGPGRAGRELRGLSVAHTGAGVEHPADGGGAALATARTVPGGRGMSGVRRAARPSGWSRIVSGDRPGHPVATALVVLLLVLLAVAPFVFPGTRSLAAASRICVFVVLAASYDILLGYTGIVSFAHTMFFAFGAYGVAIPLANGWVGWDAILVGALGGTALAVVVAAGIGLLSLRVRAVFFSMITLAVASFAQILATQLRDVTGGEDGLTFSVPRVLTPAYRLLPDPVLGVRVDGR